MQIHRERVHHHYFGRLRSDKLRGLIPQKSVIWHPRILCVKMAFHAQLRPIVEFLLNAPGHTLRLQAQ